MTTTATFTVNGRQRAFPEGANELELLTLLAELDVHAETRGVAVAVNGEIVPRSNWANTALNADDEVDVVGAVQGG